MPKTSLTAYRIRICIHMLIFALCTFNLVVWAPRVTPSSIKRQMYKPADVHWIIAKLVVSAIAVVVLPLW